MPRKKKEEIIEEKITVVGESEILESNYMPYAMSVITARALPAIDGFKPSQRKLLYTMQRMGLSSGNRTKSANIAGEVMKLNPHEGNYDTMVRLTQKNEALLCPFVDGKGNFGKVYSTDPPAAFRYTEAKLTAIATDCMSEIPENAVDLVDNYDATLKEPVLLPTPFPNILVSANMGIAVGMACNFPGFNFGEVCKMASEYIKHPKTDILTLMPAPDFTTGGEIEYDENEMRQIYETGTGSFAVRSVYHTEKDAVIITEIPYQETVQGIIGKIVELLKADKLPYVSDVRDETDINGLKIAIEFKKGYQDKIEQTMRYLLSNTPLKSRFSCNLNLLIDGLPVVLGVKDILDRWIDFRVKCKTRVLQYQKDTLSERLHLLLGLLKILLDIDKAVSIVRKSSDKEVVPNLMKGFEIDEKQAEYVANIKLRNLNKDYILKQTKDIEDLKKKIAAIEKILSSSSGVKNVIAKELLELASEYPGERRTKLVEKESETAEITDIGPAFYEEVSDGYFKRSAKGLPIGGEILVFTDNALCYKVRTENIGEQEQYIGSLAGIGIGESVKAYFPLEKGKFVAILYENGKVSLYKHEDYETVQSRKCLKNAYSQKLGVFGILSISETDSLVLTTSKKNKKVFTVSDLSLQGKGSEGIYMIRLKSGEQLKGFTASVFRK